jgi:hypothetical protein
MVAIVLMAIFSFEKIQSIFFPPFLTDNSVSASRETVRSKPAVHEKTEQPHSEMPSKFEGATLAPVPLENHMQERLPQDDPDGQTARAYAESLATIDRGEPDAPRTELEHLKTEQLLLLEEQAKQEAAAYEESLGSTDAPQAKQNLTDLERLEAEQQQLLKEQTERDAAAYEESLGTMDAPQAKQNLTHLERLEAEQQRLLEEQAEREAAAYKESLDSMDASQAKQNLTGP